MTSLMTPYFCLALHLKISVFRFVSRRLFSSLVKRCRYFLILMHDSSVISYHSSLLRLTRCAITTVGHVLNEEPEPMDSVWNDRICSSSPPFSSSVWRPANNRELMLVNYTLYAYKHAMIFCAIIDRLNATMAIGCNTGFWPGF